MHRIEIVADVKPQLGEGALWDAALERLFWVDITGCKLFRSTADGGELRAWSLPAMIGAVALRADGQGALVALQTGIHTLDFATGEVSFVCDPEPGRPENRLNDGKVDAAGRFIIGSMSLAEDEPTGAVYSLEPALGPELTLRTLDTGFTITNGPCWSPDSSTFYCNDSVERQIWAYDYDLATGAVSGRRSFARLGAEDVGTVDGSTVDSEGFLWSARVFGGSIVRYTPTGEIDRVIEMPVAKVTSVVFGGSGLDTLFVTSMSTHPAMPHDPIARGSVFKATGLGATGVPAPRFGA